MVEAAVTHSMIELFNAISNADGTYHTVDRTGGNITENGATTTLAIGVYKCSESACASDSVMLSTHDLFGSIKCINDDGASLCVLDCESSRIAMQIYGTGTTGKLLMQSIRFHNGKSEGGGGGMLIGHHAKVEINLCAFVSCKSLNEHYGGGAILVDYSSTVLNIYATTFTGNSAAGSGDDIYNNGGTVTIHDTCPSSPYSANTPTQGKKDDGIH